MGRVKSMIVERSTTNRREAQEALLQLEPKVLPETVPFWAAADQERLVIPRCEDCGRTYFPPAPICPACSSRLVQWIEASGRGTLYSFAIAQNPWPQWLASGEPLGPMSVAVVELEEGPRLLSTIVGCPQTRQALDLDMPLIATWRAFGQRPKMLCFKPASAGAQPL